MTNQQHPITPPLEMLQQWASEYWGNPGECLGNGEKYIATKAAQWSADQELEACCEYMKHEDFHGFASELRAARRPKLPSLKEVALEDLRSIELLQKEHKIIACTFNIRRALEALPND